jgi:probable HAF family extracellular repeat protein
MANGRSALPDALHRLMKALEPVSHEPAREHKERKFKMSKIRWAQATLVALAAFIFIGCGGGGGGGGTSTGSSATAGTTGTVAVAINPPDAATVVNGQRTFAATVTGNANTAVTWSVVGSGHGSVSSSGVYTAPATSGTYTVVATSQADPNKSAQVNIVVGTDAFIHVGDLPGGTFSSGVQGLDADGSTVVGFGTPTPPSGQAVTGNAILWKDAGGIAALTNVGPGTAYSVSSNGATVVGVHQISPSITAFTWTGGVLTDLPNLPGGTGSSTAFGVSGDGSIVVGQGSTASNATHAAKWVSGVVTDLGTLSGGSFSLARAISTDGNVIVG